MVPLLKLSFVLAPAGPTLQPASNLNVRLISVCDHTINQSYCIHSPIDRDRSRSRSCFFFQSDFQRHADEMLLLGGEQRGVCLV